MEVDVIRITFGSDYDAGPLFEAVSTQTPGKSDSPSCLSRDLQSNQSTTLEQRTHAKCHEIRRPEAGQYPYRRQPNLQASSAVRCSR